LENEYLPNISSAPFNPDFIENIYFLYSGKKKNSREGIAAYRSKSLNPVYLSEISSITEKVVETKNFSDFSELIKIHELLTSNHLDLVPIQKEYFSDFGLTMSRYSNPADKLSIIAAEPRKVLKKTVTIQQLAEFSKVA
jgi:hypothetical protein